MRRVHIAKPRPLEVLWSASYTFLADEVPGGDCMPYLFAPVTRMVTVEDGLPSGSCGCTSIKAASFV